MKKNETPPESLYNKALRLSKDITLEQLYDSTRLPISWLRKFRSGSIKNPNVHRIELIIRNLTGKPISFE